MLINTFSETGSPLFHAVFVPNLSDNTKKGLQKSDAEIINMLGRKNRVAVGKPDCSNFNRIFATEKQTIPQAFKELSCNYDFYLLDLSCSFLPDPDCEFVWARFGVELNAYADGKRLKEKPIAYDMYPDEVFNEITIKNEMAFSSNFKINPSILNIEEGLKITDSKEYAHYEPEITAFGIRTSNVAWDFKATSRKYINGNIRKLMIIVQTQKNSNIKGRFLIGAEIKTNNIFVPLKRIDDLINTEYTFSE